MSPSPARASTPPSAEASDELLLGRGSARNMAHCAKRQFCHAHTQAHIYICICNWRNAMLLTRATSEGSAKPSRRQATQPGLTIGAPLRAPPRAMPLGPAGAGHRRRAPWAAGPLASARQPRQGREGLPLLLLGARRTAHLSSATSRRCC
eukprot:8386998-Pyramimonas_sp.AAC.1